MRAGTCAWLHCLRHSAQLNASVPVSTLLQPGRAGTPWKPTPKCHLLPQACVGLLCLHLRLCAEGASGGSAAAIAPAHVGVQRDAGGRPVWCSVNLLLTSPDCSAHHHETVRWRGCVAYKEVTQALPYSNFPREVSMSISSYCFLCISTFFL